MPSGPLGLDLDDVTFAYRTGGPVLTNVSLTIPAGTNVAVVGETGSGKSTLAKLLVRLADPSSGTIRVGDVDIREVDAGSRRSALRIVPQDGFLFNTSLGDNVAYGREGASRVDVLAAFERLGLESWVASLPHGLETQVGERGGQMSVGERQLVALARAQLADPGILVLDEATSAVDPETEVALTSALERLSAGRTTISIAHRLSTAERADLIVVFDAGQIVEQGSHDDLVAAGGRYGALYESWIGNTRLRSA